MLTSDPPPLASNEPPSTPTPPPAKRGFLRIWQRFLDSEEGMGLGLADSPPSGGSIGRDREREFE